MKKAEVAFIKNDIKDLTKITNIFLPKIINKQLNKVFSKGNLEGEFLEEQVEAIADISRKISQLRLIGEDGHGIWNFVNSSLE